MMTEILRPKLRKNSTNKTKSVAQTATTRNSKPKLAPAGKTCAGACFATDDSLSVGCVKPSLPGRDVEPDPFLGDRRQSAVGVHLLEDLLDFGLPFWIALVGRDPDRFSEKRLAYILELTAGLLDPLLGGKVAVDHRVQALARSECEVLEGGV